MEKDKISKNERVEDKLNSFIGKNSKLILVIGIRADDIVVGHQQAVTAG